MEHAKSDRTWTVAEAKAKLSEILRLAEEEGPQRIGLRRSFVVVPESTVAREIAPREALGPMAGREYDARRQPRDSRPTVRNRAREIPYRRLGSTPTGAMIERLSSSTRNVAVGDDHEAPPQPPASSRFLTSGQAEFWLAALVVARAGVSGCNCFAHRSRRRKPAASPTLSRFHREPMHAERIRAPRSRAAVEWAARAEGGCQTRAGPSFKPRRHALIAGTAKAHRLAIATRNVRDFEGMDIDLVNPWESPIAAICQR